MGDSFPGFPCHRTAAFAIKAFAGALEAESVDGTVSVAVIRRLCDALSRDPGPLAPRFATAESDCASQFAARQLDQQRRNYVGRIFVKKISTILTDDGDGLKRSHLPQLFHALTIILGEEACADLRRRCEEVLEVLSRDGEVTRWDEFYAAPEIRLVLQNIQVAIARAFRRFDLRKEWFMTIMNSGATCQSVGSKKKTESPDYFTEQHLLQLLGALFDEFRKMDEAATKTFIERWGVEPEQVFGQIFVELAKEGVLR